jgi:hypothetical protein
VKSRTCIDLRSLKNLYELVGDFLHKNAELKS